MVPLIIGAIVPKWLSGVSAAIRSLVYLNALPMKFQPIPFCLVHHPQLNLAFERVRQLMIKHSLHPYQETTGKGEVRYLQGVVQRESGRVQLTIILNIPPQGEQAHRWRLLVKEFGEEYPDLWHSLWLNFNNKATNTIFGSEWSLLYGEEELWENFSEVEVCYGPSSFGQANLPLFEKMLMRIREILPDRARVAEFYAGVGAIGLFIVSQCLWVRCSEINPFAEAYFNRSCSRLPPDIASKLSFVSVPTHQALALLNDASSLIVDPPRKGLDPSFQP